MPKLHQPRSKRRDVLFAGIALLVVIADQLTKWWILATLAPGESFMDTAFFQIIHVQNTGASFGMFKDHPLVFTIFDFVGIIVFLLFVFFLPRRWPSFDRILVRVGLGFVLGGTIGNLIDRLRLGQVTDFLDFKIWPVFNVADASITVGVLILVFCIVFLVKTGGNRV